MEENRVENLNLAECCFVWTQENGQLKTNDLRQYGVVFLGIILRIIRQRTREGSQGHLSAWVDFAADCSLNGGATLRSWSKSNSGP